MSRTRPIASILIVEHGTGEHLERCLRALEDSALPRERFEIIVVDNASPTPVDHLRPRFASVRWLRSRRNLGFAGGCTLALTRARGDVILSVNPDAIVAPRWLSEVLATFDADPRVGVVGSKLIDPETRLLQHAGGRLFATGRSEHIGRGEDDRGQYDALGEVEYVCGAAFGVRRAVIDEVGFLSPAYYPAYYEETELCVRARAAGWKVVVAPGAVAEHHESVASGGAATDAYLARYHESRVRFVLRNRAPRRWLTEFLPAEAAWLWRMSRRERRIATRAHLRVLASPLRPDRGTPRPGDVIEEVAPSAPREDDAPAPLEEPR